jgi:hypothetical protein
MHPYLAASLLSVATVAACVVVHYEVLVQLERLSRWLRGHRWMILIVVHGLLLAHVVEIWLFALTYYVAEHWFEIGGILPANTDPFDYAYFSAMVYSTVGFGDVIPVGATRMITSTEALAGLSLITWSASFTFLQMQRMWRY